MLLACNTTKTASNKRTARNGAILTLKEMKRRYPNQWVLVADPELDKNLEVLRGKVLWHGKDRDELYQKDAEFKPRHAAYVRTGGLPRNLAYAL